jgi:hypothetical protein
VFDLRRSGSYFFHVGFKKDRQPPAANRTLNVGAVFRLGTGESRTAVR